jgi:hypothetical protein
MKVSVHLTIDGQKETILEGEARSFDGLSERNDVLENKGLGFWLERYRFAEAEGKRYQKGRVFCPWTSVLYVQTREEGSDADS